MYGCVGGLGEKTTVRGFNRATQALRQTGSAGKPLSVLVPAIDKKIITPSTLYLDEATTFDDGTEEGYSPTDYNDYRGEITVRQAVESSQNIPFVKIMEQITPKVSIQYMKKLGITSLTETDENLNLALGGLDKGISPLEMASAYACIANDGIYIEPTFYTKIENSIGKTVVKSNPSKKRVISKEVAFIVKSLLTSPVEDSNGTAKYCKISGIDVAAKTGTTNEEYDRWLCGFTPYYTAVTWFGFDLNETIKFNGKNPSGQIWASVMKTIHSDLKNAKFEAPKSIETATICQKTGLLAYSNCTNAYTEYFLKGTIPNSYCTEHSGTKVKTTNNESSVSNDSSNPKEQDQKIETTPQSPPSTTEPQTNVEDHDTQKNISNTSSSANTNSTTNTNASNNQITNTETITSPPSNVATENNDYIDNNSNNTNNNSVSTSDSVENNDSSENSDDNIFEQ